MARIAGKMENSGWPIEAVQGAIHVIGEYLELPWTERLEELVNIGANSDETYYLELVVEYLLKEGHPLIERIVAMGAISPELSSQIMAIEQEDQVFSRAMSAMRRGTVRTLVKSGYQFEQGLGVYDHYLDELWQLLVARNASIENILSNQVKNVPVSPAEIEYAGYVRQYLKEIGLNGVPLGELEETILCLSRHLYSTGKLSIAVDYIVDGMEGGLQAPMIYYDYFIIAADMQEFDDALKGFQAACERDPAYSPVPLDIYKVSHLLGKNRLTTTFYGMDSEQQPVILKSLVLPPPEARTAIQNVIGVDHPGIAKIYDLYESDTGGVCMAMEYCEGITLEQYVAEQGSLAFEEATTIIYHIADALNQVHNQEGVHGNLTPEAILVHEGGIKIYDFGLFPLFTWPASLRQESLSDLHYLAPELLEPGSVPKSADDIYSLVKILSFLLTGVLPYHVDKTAISQVAAIVDKTLQPDAAARYQDLGEFLSDLQYAVENPEEGGETQQNTPAARVEVSDSIELDNGELLQMPSNFIYQDGTIYCKQDNSQMVAVPKGSFTMGTHGRLAESPEHEVYLDNYIIDRFPVTNGQYSQFLKYIENSNDHTKCHPNEPPNKNHSPKGWQTPEYTKYSSLENSPVIFVDWWDAWAYAAWSGKKLPTEAQWEKAARGRDARKFPWGEEDPQAQHANFGNNSGKCTSVGSYPQGTSPYGCLDMAGNVWEWCLDTYKQDFYHNSPKENPAYTDDKIARALRGGSWNDGINSLRAACRACWVNSVRYAYIGFRCAYPL